MAIAGIFVGGTTVPLRSVTEKARRHRRADLREVAIKS
jgi:hypothetical protein